MATCVFFSHPASVEHDTGPHPERRERIIAIERHLEQTGWFGFERRDAPRVDRELLETCHDPGYVGALQRLCAAGGGQIDDDTLVSEGSWEAAMRSAGGAVAVVDVLLSGEALAAFSAGRPPGHHALRARAMGFCLFNNIALAAIHAITAHALERVLILDWDVHHGNGTNDLFHSSAEVFYVSIHQSPLYPASGPASDHGSGAGEGFTLNLPLPRGTAFAAWRAAFAVALARIRDFGAEALVVSLGVDTFVADPISFFRLESPDFAAYGRMIGESRIPTLFVLEGGYAVAEIGVNAVNVLSGFEDAR